MTQEERAVLERLFPISLKPYTIKPNGSVGLVIVDPGQGFTRFGNLADPTHMVPMVGRIAYEYRRLKAQLDDHLHVLIFLDTHQTDIPEPPYPPHCIMGTGEEDIDPDLEFLLKEPSVRVIRKNCINGFVGAMRHVGWIDAIGHRWANTYVDWLIENRLSTLLFTGDCTDICVSDLVVTSLSARNHGMFATHNPQQRAYVQDITSMDFVILASACETFDAPAIGHDREAWHHVGLATMASRGAILASKITVE